MAVGQNACASPVQPQTLVALRAVGRNVEEVAALSPDDVALQLVQFCVRRFEGSDPFEFRVQHHALHPVRFRLRAFGKPGEFHISETVEGEGRLPGDLCRSLRPCRSRSIWRSGSSPCTSCRPWFSISAKRRVTVWSFSTRDVESTAIPPCSAPDQKQSVPAPVR